MEDTQEQHQKQNYDWLKGYQFVKGQSGNPGGRPKGAKSMKTFVREYFENLPDEEKVAFLKSISPIDAWRMGEGNPDSKSDIKQTIEINNLSDIPNDELDRIIAEGAALEASVDGKG